MRALATAFVLTALAYVPASAETVFVKSGRNEGQGWMFLHATGCWVATASHVVIDGAGTLVVGPNGAQAQADRIVRHSSVDVAVLHVAGTSAHGCTSSTLGDRDEGALLDRLRHQDGSMEFERRSGEPGRTVGVSYGVESIPMQILGISDRDPTFTMRPIQAVKDRIGRSDSGGPIRFRGSGLGEAGLPLGLIISVDNGITTAVRMDAIRGFVDAFASSGAPNSSEVPAAYSIAAFTGGTPDTACGPLNVMNRAAPCGWNARRDGSRRIALTLDLGTDARTISAVIIRFDAGATPNGFEIATSSDVAADGDWIGLRYCPVRPASHEVTCTLGQRTARGVRIIFDGARAHIREVRIAGASPR
jgi:hypothetical protein